MKRYELSEVEMRGRKLLEWLREFNPRLDYDSESVAWLDGFFERNRNLFSEDQRYGIAMGLGYVCGQAIIRDVGGEWEYDEGQLEWLINVGPLVGHANPIGKAYKHLTGPYDSIASLLRVTKLVVERGGWDQIGEQTNSGDSG
jgi:hypothetical protein